MNYEFLQTKVGKILGWFKIISVMILFTIGCFCGCPWTNLFIVVCDYFSSFFFLFWEKIIYLFSPTFILQSTQCHIVFFFIHSLNYWDSLSLSHTHLSEIFFVIYFALFFVFYKRRSIIFQECNKISFSCIDEFNYWLPFFHQIFIYKLSKNLDKHEMIYLFCFNMENNWKIHILLKSTNRKIMQGQISKLQCYEQIFWACQRIMNETNDSVTLD